MFISSNFENQAQERSANMLRRQAISLKLSHFQPQQKGSTPS